MKFDSFLEAESKSPLDVFQMVQKIYRTYSPTVTLNVTPIRDYVIQARGYLAAGLEVARSADALNRIHDLRHLQNELKKDRPFFAFVVRQMARATAELEDEWNLINDSDESQNQKRLDILTRWLTISDDVASRVANLVLPL